MSNSAEYLNIYVEFVYIYRGIYGVHVDESILYNQYNTIKSIQVVI